MLSDKGNFIPQWIIYLFINTTGLGPSINNKFIENSSYINL